jgi:23S rRNA (uracil1939-C5)-methyltransferase
MTESLIHCEHSVRCGGCPAISLSYEDQLEKKHAAVQSAFALFTELAHVRIEPVQAARPITQYRTRAKWVTGKHGALGLFSLGTHEVQDLPQCKVIAPAIARGALALRSLISQLDRNPALVTVADGGALYAVDLRELVQRDASTKLLVTLVVLSSRCTIEQAREACSRLVNEGIAKSAAASWHDGRNVQMLGENPRIYAGDPEPTDVLVQGKLWQLVSPGSFVQTHRNTAAAIHDLIVRELSHTQRAQIPTRVLELYAGSGALGLKLAASGMHVRCVESFAPAVAQIDRAARLQGLKSISAIAQDAAARTRQSIVFSVGSAASTQACVCLVRSRDARTGRRRARCPRLSHAECATV